ALGIDTRLDAGDPALVDDIARVRCGSKARRFYSFATKYCAWHRPDDYQIYDSQADAALWAYRRQHSFATFRRQDLQTYRRFIEVIDAFRRCFGIEGVGRKELDMFLWEIGRQ